MKISLQIDQVFFVFYSSISKFVNYLNIENEIF